MGRHPPRTRYRWVLPVLLLVAAGLVEAQPPGAIDLTGLAIRDGRILRADGGEVGVIEAAASRGARVALTPDGGIVLGDQVYGEALATLEPPDDAPPSAYVFETRFALSRPEGLYAHMLILSPRVAPGPDAASYRIAYRFCGPCAVANNNTGFYLTNTGAPEVRADPLYAAPLAGAPYRLTPGREYVAYCVVRDLPEGVSIRFLLHDTTLTDDDAQPLFEYVDTSVTRIEGSADARVQVGCGGLIHPAARAWFGGMRVYPLECFEEARRERAATATPPLSELEAPVPPEQTELPNVLSDNMVVQRGKPIAVWGRGIEGDEVTVSLGDASATATVVQGTWRVALPPLRAGGPLELTVAGRDRTLTVRNVMVGEVWVLGGQSNMGWWLRSDSEAATEVPASNYPEIRVFSGWHPSAAEPQFEVAGGTWKVVSPDLNGAFSAVGYYFARALHQRLGVPIGLLDTSTPATGIECWMSQRAAEKVFGEALSARPGRFIAGLGDPACYYNGKVAPVMPFGVAGFVWYQGDGSTAPTGRAYRDYIPALMRDWREGFGQGELPFLIVQIPCFEGCSPEMRESQLLSALREPNAAIAVTLDVGEPTDIHPRNKRPVGERLAFQARAMAYGEPIEYMGPIYRGMTVRGGRAYLTFDHVGGGLVLDGDGGFEIRGADGAYVPAHASLSGDNELAVWSEAVATPVAVRYAWAPVPTASLRNEDGLLASPFRTRED